MANEGTFRPLKLILPPGKILSADPTAPMGNYSTPFPTVIDAVIKALEKALPERVPGGHFGTHSGIRFYGRRADGSYLRHPRLRPRRLGRLRDPRRRRPVPHHGARRHPHHPAGTAGDLSAGADRGILAARGFRRRRDNSAAAWASARATACWRHASCRPISTARASRPGACRAARRRSPAASPSSMGQPGENAPIEKEKGLRLAAGDVVSHRNRRRRRLWSAGRTRHSDRIQRDLDAGYVSREAAERDYGVTVGAGRQGAAVADER